MTLTLCIAAIIGCAAGCDREKTEPAAASDSESHSAHSTHAATTTAPATRPSVASLVPAVTDILFQMGLGDRVVGISNYDPQSPDRANLPRVGDYHSVDWEKLSSIRPGALIIQRPKEELAPTYLSRAQSMGITLVPFHCDRLADIYPAIEQIGATVGEADRAKSLIDSIQRDLRLLHQRVDREPRVRTLILLDEGGQFVVGRNNFLDDLLAIAGGTNVAANMAGDYPRIDREQLLKLDPDAVIVLLPEAPPQVVEATKRFWASIPLAAGRNGRVYVHTEWYLLHPGARVVNIAEKMAADLHPLTAAPATTTTESR